VWTDPNSGLGQVSPGGDLFPGRHVRVSVALKSRLELLQLLTCEVRSLSPLTFRFLVSSAAANHSRIDVVSCGSTLNDAVIVYTSRNKCIHAFTTIFNNY